MGSVLCSAPLVLELQLANTEGPKRLKRQGAHNLSLIEC